MLRLLECELEKWVRVRYNSKTVLNRTKGVNLF